MATRKGASKWGALSHGAPFLVSAAPDGGPHIGLECLRLPVAMIWCWALQGPLVTPETRFNASTQIIDTFSNLN